MRKATLVRETNKVSLAANQSNLKSIQKALIGWIKAGLPKRHFYFAHANRLLASRLSMEAFFQPIKGN